VATSGKVAMARDGDSEPVTTAMIAAPRGTPRGLLGSIGFDGTLDRFDLGLERLIHGR
jgi:hypothetical protein